MNWTQKSSSVSSSRLKKLSKSIKIHGFPSVHGEMLGFTQQLLATHRGVDGKMRESQHDALSSPLKPSANDIDCIQFMPSWLSHDPHSMGAWTAYMKASLDHHTRSPPLEWSGMRSCPGHHGCGFSSWNPWSISLLYQKNEVLWNWDSDIHQS